MVCCMFGHYDIFPLLVLSAAVVTWVHHALEIHHIHHSTFPTPENTSVHVFDAQVSSILSSCTLGATGCTHSMLLLTVQGVTTIGGYA